MTPDEQSQVSKMRAEAMTRQGDLESQEDAMYSEAAPKGRFTSKAANALVDATNRLLPLFGIKDLYDRFTEPQLTTLPPEFVRLLTMFSKAFDDAIEEGILSPDAKIDLAVVTDDSGLQGLAGRIGMAAKNAGFKRFLSKRPTQEPPMEEEETAEEEMPAQEVDTDSLFSGRI